MLLPPNDVYEWADDNNDEGNVNNLSGKLLLAQPKESFVKKESELKFILNTIKSHCFSRQKVKSIKKKIN